MSLNSDDKNHDKKGDENKRTKRNIETYQKNDRPSIKRPLEVSGLGTASIAATDVMLSSGAYFVKYVPSIHAEWHTSPRQSSSYWLANSVNLIPSSSVHVTEANIAAFGVITMALAAVPAIVSFGLFRGRSWSWNASIIFFAVA